MKILVCGKGGCGKSVVATLIAKALSKLGKRVLVVDMDESNFGIYRNFGVKQPRDFIKYLGGRRAVKKRLDSKIFKEIAIKDLPPDYVISKGNISIMAIGKIREFGEGCACPIGAVAREFLNALKLKENEYVIVDTDAGIEHFGRGVEAGCDVIVAVVEPSYESIQLTEKIVEMSKKIGKDVIVVANKVDNETSKLIKADAYIPFKKEIFHACLKGEEIPLINEISDVIKFIIRLS